MAKKPNIEAVRAFVTDAEPVRSIGRFRDDPEPGGTLNGVKPGQWVPDILGLPPGCPVTPLGVDGDVNWFLDPIGQLVAYGKPYGQADTLNLFRGRHLFLYWAWPKFGRKETDDGVAFTVDAWRNEKAREALIAAATAKGSWNAVEKVRGRGSWAGPDGKLIIHCGEDIVMAPSRVPPGEIFGNVYPTRPPITAPWPRPVPEDENPAKMLRLMLQTWSWARPGIDPHLLIGWIGVAFLGAALPWRPAVFLTGDKGSGKSTLQELLKGVFGPWLLQATNTTAAGIYQHVGNDSLPVAVDEFEGKADNTRARALLELARQASSGGLMLRGGDRHTGVEFQARSAFLFSSINTPPMEPQDLSRFALLRLHRLVQGQKPPNLDPKILEIIGRHILRRLIDQWSRFGETFEAFAGELARAGMDGRGQDTFGTLLTCADMIEHDGWHEDRLGHLVEGELKPWAELMATQRMVEFEDATENWRLCLDHLLSVPVEAWRNGTRSTVGQVLEEWFKGDAQSDFNNDVVKVRTVLGQAGLGLQKGTREVGDWLIVPNQNPLTRRLFEQTKWAGDIGASVWSGALRQAPRGEIYEAGQARVNGVKLKCTLISLRGLYGPDGIMVDSPSVNTPRPDPIMAGK